MVVDKFVFYRLFLISSAVKNPHFLNFFYSSLSGRDVSPTNWEVRNGKRETRCDFQLQTSNFYLAGLKTRDTFLYPTSNFQPPTSNFRHAPYFFSFNAFAIMRDIVSNAGKVPRSPL